jgi:hypothetical protein
VWLPFPCSSSITEGQTFVILDKVLGILVVSKGENQAISLQFFFLWKVKELWSNFSATYLVILDYSVT